MAGLEQEKAASPLFEGSANDVLGSDLLDFVKKMQKRFEGSKLVRSHDKPIVWPGPFAVEKPFPVEELYTIVAIMEKVCPKKKLHCFGY